MNPMLNIAIRAARKAGNVIAKSYERRDDIEITSKNVNDYVTNVDKAAPRTAGNTQRRNFLYDKLFFLVLCCFFIVVLFMINISQIIYIHFENTTKSNCVKFRMIEV